MAVPVLINTPQLDSGMGTRCLMFCERHGEASIMVHVLDEYSTKKVRVSRARGVYRGGVGRGMPIASSISCAGEAQAGRPMAPVSSRCSRSVACFASPTDQASQHGIQHPRSTNVHQHKPNIEHLNPEASMCRLNGPPVQPWDQLLPVASPPISDAPSTCRASC